MRYVFFCIGLQTKCKGINFFLIGNRKKEKNEVFDK